MYVSGLPVPPGRIGRNALNRQSRVGLRGLLIDSGHPSCDLRDREPQGGVILGPSRMYSEGGSLQLVYSDVGPWILLEDLSTGVLGEPCGRTAAILC